MKEFVESSVELISVCVKDIKQYYALNLENYKTWEKWYDTKAPLTTDVDVTDYCNRLTAKGIANTIFHPLKMDLLNPGPIKNINWKVTHSYSDLHDPTFEWPEQLQAALNSVTYTGNLSPPPPRLISTSDQFLKEKTNKFKEKVAGFYIIMSNKTTAYLKTKVLGQILHDGAKNSLPSSKKEALKRMESWGRYFFSTILKPLGGVYQTLIQNYFKDPLTINNENEIISNPFVPEIQVNFLYLYIFYNYFI